MDRKIFNSRELRIKLDVDEFKPCRWWLRGCNSFFICIYCNGDFDYYVFGFSNKGILPVCTI